jgi:hypothetical protein
MLRSKKKKKKKIATNLREANKAVLDGANGLLNSFLKVTTNRHNLTNRFHRRRNLGADTVELFQVPKKNQKKKSAQPSISKNVSS